MVLILNLNHSKGELPIAMALASVVGSGQMDELARVLVSLFDAKHLLAPLLWNIFYREVEVCAVSDVCTEPRETGQKLTDQNIIFLKISQD